MITEIENAFLYRAEYHRKSQQFKTKSRAIDWLTNQILRWTLTHDEKGHLIHPWVWYDRQFFKAVRSFLRKNTSRQTEQWVRDHRDEYIWHYNYVSSDDCEQINAVDNDNYQSQE